MTWSIIARDPPTGAYGIAVATRFFAVGSLVPHAHGQIGALCTQALVNPIYGPSGLKLLAEGVAAAEVVKRLTAADAGAAHRQLHVMDRAGRTAPPFGRQPALLPAVPTLPADTRASRRHLRSRDHRSRYQSRAGRPLS